MWSIRVILLLAIWMLMFMLMGVTITVTVVVAQDDLPGDSSSTADGTPGLIFSPCPVVPLVAPTPNPAFATQPNATCAFISGENSGTDWYQASALADTPLDAWLVDAVDPVSGNTSRVSCLTTKQFLSGLDDKSVPFPGRLPNVGSSDPPAYHQGDYAAIAVVIAGAEQVVKTIFYPQVDSLALLTISNSTTEAYLSHSSSVRIRLESLYQFSEPRSRYDPTCEFVVPFYTAVIALDDGLVTGIRWEDDCSTCSLAACVNNNCGIELNTCAGFGEESLTIADSLLGIDCTLKVYLAWEGTDSSGNVLTSSGRTISNFRKWSINSLYNNVVDIANQNLPTLSNDLSGCTVYDSSGRCISQS